jgi:ABC-type glycerol-3-phosphate transport system permease component
VVVVALATIPFLFPFWILLATALKPLREFQEDPISWPDHPTTGNLSAAWTEAELGPALLNSVIAVTVGVIVTAAVSAAAAFWFLRHTGRLARVLRVSLIGTMAIPPPIFIIPLFVLLADWRATNDLVVLGLVYAAWNAGFGIYLMYAYYRGAIPAEVLEAAEVDGASSLRQFVRLIVPLSRPALATLAALVFVWSWSDLLISVILIQDAERRTIVPATALLADRYFSDIPSQAAAVLIALIPMLVAFLVGQRYLKRGIMAGVGK